MGSKAKPIYDASVSYWTPSGKKVLYGCLVAAETESDCMTQLLGRLDNAVRFGRRRIGRIGNDFKFTYVTHQIETR